MSSIATQQLRRLVVAPDRRPGSPGNDEALDYAAGVLRDLGWHVDTPEFSVMTWEGTPGRVVCGDVTLPVQPSWYAIGVSTAGPLVAADTVGALDALVASGGASGAVLLLHGALTAAALTPQDYPFYSVPGHDELRAQLAGSGAVAVLAATPGTDASPAPVGPFVEDGLFPLPAIDVAPTEVAALLTCVGSVVSVEVAATRGSGTARNVVARNGIPVKGRVLMTAHIDTKPGTPGALDNAAGVAVLLRAAGLLRDTDAPVEMVLFNGEDHYAAPGELDWLRRLRADGEDLDAFTVMVNVDAPAAAGHRLEWSGYHLPVALEAHVRDVMARHDIAAGPAWYQSDHGIFALAGRPAVAVTSSDLSDLLTGLVHTREDTVDRVDPEQVERAGRAVAATVAGLPLSS